MYHISIFDPFHHHFPVAHHLFSVLACRFLPPLSVSVFLCPPSFHRQHVSDDVCVVGSSPPPPSALPSDYLPSAVEYFLLSLTHLSFSSPLFFPRFMAHINRHTLYISHTIYLLTQSYLFFNLLTSSVKGKLWYF